MFVNKSLDWSQPIQVWHCPTIFVVQLDHTAQLADQRCTDGHSALQRRGQPAKRDGDADTGSGEFGCLHTYLWCILAAKLSFLSIGSQSIVACYVQAHTVVRQMFHQQAHVV